MPVGMICSGCAESVVGVRECEKCWREECEEYDGAPETAGGSSP